MTNIYEQLKNEPQININRSSLNPDERVELRTIEINKSPGRTVSNPKGKFTTIYYLAGDEDAAAAKFVEENRELLEQIDFSKKDRIQTSVNREIYDLILDVFGARNLIRYETVILEERPNGIQWLIDRKKYETNPNRRYTIGEPGSARIPSNIILADIYNQFDDIITEDDLTDKNIEGDIRQVLDYFRVCEEFNCKPITVDGSKLAIQKIGTNEKKSN